MPRPCATIPERATPLEVYEILKQEYGIGLHEFARVDPKGANPKNIPPAYLDQKMLPVLINYCIEKGFIDVVGVRTDQEGIVDVEKATLKADGIDYLLKL